MNWFSLSEVEAFSASLASEFVQRAPADVVQDGARGSKKRLSDAQQALLIRVEKFASERQLNFYKRASLANKFKWLLLEKGYSVDIVDPIVLELVKAASKKI